MKSGWYDFLLRLSGYAYLKMAKFTEHEVVPDVLSAAPASVAEVVWPSGAKAEQGNVLTPTQVCKLPGARSQNYGIISLI
jgi:hypothetical protein